MDGPLRFSSSFECGNLLTAKLVSTSPPTKGSSSSSAAPPGSTSDLEYELHVDSDTQSAQGHTQWFYFSVRNGSYTGNVQFRIVNLRKKKSLYQQGLQPHVFSTRKKTRGWEPFCCQGVSYTANSVKQKGEKTDASSAKAEYNTLTWSYRIDRKDDELYFAAYPPYTYSMLNYFLDRLDRHGAARMHFRRFELCRSIGQLPVPLLVISEDVGREDSAALAPGSPPPPSDNAVEESEQNHPRSDSRPAARGPKMAVVITARQHPGEVVGSWAVQGLLKFLLGPTPAARRLREDYVFHVVPMVNVDGVVHGNSRCTLAGVDPNRVWHDPNPILHPVIFTMKNHLRCLAQGLPTSASGMTGGPVRGIEVFFDLHGHSAKFGCFFYGSNPTAHISNAIFPKLCSMISSDLSFEQCHWRCSRSHRKTARYVVHKQFGVKYAYTIECSLFAPVPQFDLTGFVPENTGIDRPSPFENAHFTPPRVEWVGCTVCRTLAVFFELECDIVSACCLTDETNEDDSTVERTCTCEENFLVDFSCPTVLAKRPWIKVDVMNSTSAADVLCDLTLTFGDIVPDLARMLRGADGSDDGGDSDGDDGPEPPEAEEPKSKGSKDAAAQPAQPARPGASAGRKAASQVQQRRFSMSSRSAGPTPAPASSPAERSREELGAEAPAVEPMMSGDSCCEDPSPAAAAIGAERLHGGASTSSEHFDMFEALHEVSRGVSGSPIPVQGGSSSHAARRPRGASGGGLGVPASAPSRARSVDYSNKTPFDPLAVVAQPFNAFAKLQWQPGRPETRTPTRGVAYWVDEAALDPLAGSAGANGASAGSSSQHPAGRGASPVEEERPPEHAVRSPAVPQGDRLRRASTGGGPGSERSRGTTAPRRVLIPAEPEAATSAGGVSGQGHLASLCATGSGVSPIPVQLCVTSQVSREGGPGSSPTAPESVTNAAFDWSSGRSHFRTTAGTGPSQRRSNTAQDHTHARSVRGRAATERGERNRTSNALRSSVLAGGVSRRGTPPLDGDGSAAEASPSSQLDSVFARMDRQPRQYRGAFPSGH